MSEMIERVARAILAQGSGFAWEDYAKEARQHALKQARAAIEAMREPTEKMSGASPDEGVKFRTTLFGQEGTLEVRNPAAVWRAMIDAALSED